MSKADERTPDPARASSTPHTQSTGEVEQLSFEIQNILRPITIAMYMPPGVPPTVEKAMQLEVALETQLTALVRKEAYRLANEVIGEDLFVPKHESWLDGPADKPSSYRNNYEIVRYAEIQNELKSEQRKRLESLIQEDTE